jgi:hypothetical protein
VEFRQFESAVAVRGADECELTTDAVEPEREVHPPPLDRSPLGQLQAEIDEERDGVVELVDDANNVVRPDRHGRILGTGRRLPSAVARIC